MDAWGPHLILDVKGCQLEHARDPEHIKRFVKELVVRIDMVPFGEPQLIHFADNTDKAGWTVIQLITTSNITGFTIANAGSGYSNGYLVFSNGGGQISSLTITYAGSGLENGLMILSGTDQAIPAVANVEVFAANGAVRKLTLLSGGLFSGVQIGRAHV